MDAKNQNKSTRASEDFTDYSKKPLVLFPTHTDFSDEDTAVLDTQDPKNTTYKSLLGYDEALTIRMYVGDKQRSAMGIYYLQKADS
jgi:hypothetical protein